MRLKSGLRQGINLKPLKRFLIRYLGLGLLYCGKPFSRIGDWFWKLHRTVLDWNDHNG